MGGGDSEAASALQHELSLIDRCKEEPIEGLQVSSQLEFTSVGVESTVLSAVISIVAPESREDDEKRAPAHVTSVADKSGSMEGAKLNIMKNALNFLPRQLTSTDKFGLISYDSTVSEELELAKFDSQDSLSRLESVLKSMCAGTCTNLSGGLLAGIAQHHSTKANAKKTSGTKGGERGPSDEAEPMEIDNDDKETNSIDSEQRTELVRAVFLFTDGLANEGVTSTRKLVQAVKGALRDVPGRCSVFTFGLGGDHDEKMLSALAEATGGQYYYLISEESIPEAFAAALGGLLSTYAQNITVKVRPLSGARIKKVHTKFENKRLDDGSVCINLTDLYCEESRDLVIEVELPEQKVPGSVTTGKPESNQEVSDVASKEELMKVTASALKGYLASLAIDHSQCVDTSLLAHQVLQYQNDDVQDGNAVSVSLTVDEVKGDVIVKIEEIGEKQSGDKVQSGESQVEEKNDRKGKEKEAESEVKGEEDVNMGYVTPFEVEVAYFDLVRHKQVCEVVTSAAVGRRVAGHAQGRREGNRHVERHKIRMQAAEAMEEAMKLADSGREKEGHDRLQRCEEEMQLSSIYGEDDEQTQSIIADLSASKKGMKDRRSYALNRKMIFSSTTSHYIQRSAGATFSSSDINPALQVQQAQQARAFGFGSSPGGVGNQVPQQQMMMQCASGPEEDELMQHNGSQGFGFNCRASSSASFSNATPVFGAASAASFGNPPLNFAAAAEAAGVVPVTAFDCSSAPLPPPPATWLLFGSSPATFGSGGPVFGAASASSFGSAPVPFGAASATTFGGGAAGGASAQTDLESAEVPQLKPRQQCYTTKSKRSMISKAQKFISSNNCS